MCFDSHHQQWGGWKLPQKQSRPTFFSLPNQISETRKKNKESLLFLLLLFKNGKWRIPHIFSLFGKIII